MSAAHSPKRITLSLGAPDSLERLLAGEKVDRIKLVPNDDGTYTLEATQTIARIRETGRKPAAEFLIDGLNAYIEEVDALGGSVPQGVHDALDRFMEKWDAYNGKTGVTPASSAEAQR